MNAFILVAILLALCCNGEIIVSYEDEDQVLDIDNSVVKHICKCLSKHDKRLQSTYNCKHYCSCEERSGHYGVLRTCPKGMVFNTLIENCDYVTNYKCPKLPKIKNVSCNNFDYYPFPNICSLYYVCLNGKPVTLPCPNGFHFCTRDDCYHALSVCEAPHTAQCSWKTNQLVNFECPSDGLFSDAQNKSKYFFCSAEVSYHMSCSHKQVAVINSNTADCIDSENENVTTVDDEFVTSTTTTTDKIDIGDVPSTSTTTTTKSKLGNFVCPGNGLFPDPKNCSMYYHCSHSFAWHMACATNDLAFQPLIGKCDWKNYSDCQDGVTTTVQPTFSPVVGFTCPYPNGIFYYAKNCSKYLHCTANKAILRECQNGLYFSANLRVCDYPRTANCKVGQDNDFSIPQGQCPDSKEGQIEADENDCNRFFMCHYGNLFHETCGEGMLFDSIIKKCELTEYVKNCTGELPVVSNSNCTCTNCLLPHSDNNNEYYECFENGIAKLQRCHLGQTFHNKKSICEFVKKRTSIRTNNRS